AACHAHCARFGFAPQPPAHPLQMITLMPDINIAPPPAEPDEQTLRAAIEIDHVDFSYGDFRALHGIHLDLPPNVVTAFIGPSGSSSGFASRARSRWSRKLF